MNRYGFWQMLYNNIDDGYLEGLLRGFRGGILTSSDYANLCQCESIDGAWHHHIDPLTLLTDVDPTTLSDCADKRASQI